MMNILKTIALLILLFLNAQTYAQDNDNSLKTAETNKIVLTVAIEEIGYFPFNYTSNGEIKGFSIDVLNYIEENSQYDFEFIILPWPRALYLVTQGEVDLILTLFKTPERKDIYHFVEPAYGFEVNQLFTLKDKEIEFDGQLRQLMPYSIGTVREYSYGPEFDGATYLKKLPALTEPILVKLLLSERVDMMIGNPLAFNNIIAAQNLQAKFKAVTPYVALTPVHIALTKERQDAKEVLQVFKQQIENLKSTPYYQALLDKYQLNFK